MNEAPEVLDSESEMLNAIQQRRREALRKIATGVAYAVPATLLVTSMEASATSLTC